MVPKTKDVSILVVKALQTTHYYADTPQLKMFPKSLYRSPIYGRWINLFSLHGIGGIKKPQDLILSTVVSM
jgi:hypothetical protein